MNPKLYFDTVSPELLKTLKKLQGTDGFEEFRLVGGTALSLYRGHRMSVDIDLFTDKEYGSVDFQKLDDFLRSNFKYFDTVNVNLVGFGRSYYVGEDQWNCIKLDLYYTDHFIQTVLIAFGLRIAGIQDLIAMKVDVISRGGRKKDFWDLHDLIEEYSFESMIALHRQRYPHTHDYDAIKSGFSNFSLANEDFTPICLKGKHWEIIKLDMIEFIQE